MYMVDYSMYSLLQSPWDERAEGDPRRGAPAAVRLRPPEQIGTG